MEKSFFSSSLGPRPRSSKRVGLSLLVLRTPETKPSFLLKLRWDRQAEWISILRGSLTLVSHIKYTAEVYLAS